MKNIPEYSGTLRSHLLTVPKCISECSGIRIFGRRIKSLVFSTDVAIIKNVNADAIIAVYPFTPQPSITQAIISVSEVPVFVGVGGGMTNGDRSVRLAEYSEHQGASGVVVNAPITDETIRKMKAVVDIPVITTIVSGDMDIAARLEAGADILNVSGAAKTPDIVAKIRAQFPDVPIIATGGPRDEDILRTIQAGANAITYTPPTTGQLFADIMINHRRNFSKIGRLRKAPLPPLWHRGRERKHEGKKVKLKKFFEKTR
mgnify:CR=1 FL=1